MKPLIAVSSRNVGEASWVPPLSGAREPYLTAVIQAGGLPITVPQVGGPDVVEEYCRICQGLLLPGGEDVDPARYHEAPHPKLGAISKARDVLEFSLIEYFWTRKLPILAICRGIQVLNVFLGGTLTQDISSQLSTTVVHRPDSGAKSWTELPHGMKLLRGSRLAELLGGELLPVNSLHHQAVKELAGTLSAVAWSEDGLIEGAEAEDKDHFVIAVQCHPEMLCDTVDTRWQKVFEGFVKACSNPH